MRRLTEEEALLVGLSEGAHLVPAPDAPGVRVHREAAVALAALQAAATRAGFALRVASGHRDFARQLALWNAKARGERPLLDAAERPLDPRQLAPEALLHALLRWSALPGASRHHWGTDVDVYDAAALPPGASPQLRADEAGPGGPFGPLHAWLDAHAAAFGFFRPYAEERGGVSPERWHLSYAPLARRLQARHSPALLARVLADAPLALADEVRRSLPSLWERYVVNVCTPPGEHARV